MLLAALLVTSLGLASGASPAAEPRALAQTPDADEAQVSLIGAVFTESVHAPASDVVATAAYEWHPWELFGSSLQVDETGEEVWVPTPPNLPHDAELLDLAPVYVPPFDTLAWDFGADGNLEFIVRNQQNRLEWRKTKRDLTPIETVLIPGLGVVDKRQPFKEPTYVLDAVYLGASRWFIFNERATEQRSVIFDGARGQTESLAWGALFAGAKLTTLRSACGDGQGGVVLSGSLRGGGNHKSITASIDAQGRVQWLRRPGGADRNDPVMRTPDGEYLIAVSRKAFEFAVWNAQGERLRTFDFSDVGSWAWYSPVERVGPYHCSVVLELHGDRIEGERFVTRVFDVRTGELLEPHEAEGLGLAASQGGQLRSDGAFWYSDGGALLRLGAEGVVEERLGSQLEPVHGEVATRKPKLLSDGRVVALEPKLPALHIRNVDGSTARWERQGLATWEAAAVDGDGNLWITGAPEPGSRELRSVGWSRDGEPLGEFFVGGVLGFDPRGGRVWSVERTAAAEELRVRLFETEQVVAEGVTAEQVIAEHAVEVPEGWTSSGQIRPQIFVDDQGRAWVQAVVGRSSALWRFGPDGELEGERRLADFLVLGIEQPRIGPGASVPEGGPDADGAMPVGGVEPPPRQRGPFAWARRTGLSIFTEPDSWVLIDLSDIDAPSFAYLEECVPLQMIAPTFAKRGTRVRALIDAPASFTARDIGPLRWIPIR